MEVGPIIEVMRFTFLVIAWHFLPRLEQSISLRMNMSSMVSDHADGVAVRCIICTFVVLCFCFVLLVSGFYPGCFEASRFPGGHRSLPERQGAFAVCTYMGLVHCDEGGSCTEEGARDGPTRDSGAGCCAR